MSKGGLAQLSHSLLYLAYITNSMSTVPGQSLSLAAADSNNYVFILSFDLFWRFCKRASHLLDSLE